MDEDERIEYHQANAQHQRKAEPQALEMRDEFPFDNSRQHGPFTAQYRSEKKALLLQAKLGPHR